jgi:hypothetical protein
VTEAGFDQRIYGDTKEPANAAFTEFGLDVATQNFFMPVPKHATANKVDHLRRRKLARPW